MNQQNIVTAIVIATLIFIIGSCANTSTPPLGGPKDTIPPVLLSIKPDSGSVNFPLKDGVIEMEFNEYVVVKDPRNNILVSPPFEKAIETKIRGKSIYISFPEKLDSATTYNINFGFSIEDNNEGNPFPNYSFPFSTGSYLDSLICSGTVYDSFTLMPADGVIVAFYKDFSDSVVYNKLPSAVAKTDLFGYFSVRNIKNIPYKVFAFKDENNNFRYDPGLETIAFLDTLFTPTKILSSDMMELSAVGEKDTLLALARPSELDLYIFKEESDRQSIKEVKRVQKKMVTITFEAPNAKITSFKFKGIDSTEVLKEFNIRRDSLVLWIKDTSKIMPDTLGFEIDYFKTDSLYNLVPEKKDFRLVAPRRQTTEKKADIPATQGRQPNIKEKREDLMNVKIVADPIYFEEKGFVLNLEAPLISFLKDSVSLISRSPRGDETKMDFTVNQDTLSLLKMNIRPASRLLSGYDYSLLIPEGALMDIYKHTNDTLFSTSALPKDERLSTLYLDIEGVDGSYIVELTNITRDKVFRSFNIRSNTKLKFPYLSGGQYSIKITQDLNDNGIIDTGSLLQRRQPEKVRLYTLPNGSAVITLPEATELSQTIDLKQIFY